MTREEAQNTIDNLRTGLAVSDKALAASAKKLSAAKADQVGLRLVIKDLKHKLDISGKRVLLNARALEKVRKHGKQDSDDLDLATNMLQIVINGWGDYTR